MDGSVHPLRAIYSKPKSVQHCDIPASLGCELNEQGQIIVDFMQKTNIAGVYACGDNSMMGRAVAMAVSTGMMAGAGSNSALIEESF